MARYDTARAIRIAQDDYCEKALSGDWTSLSSQRFPESLKWQPRWTVRMGLEEMVRYYKAKMAEGSL